MSKQLDLVLKHIGDEFQNDILEGARNYREVDIGKHAEALGFYGLKQTYHAVNAVVPIKKPVDGMKVRVDGRTFVNYRQYDTGVVVPGFVAKESGLPHHPFVPNDSMILNF